MYANPFFKNTIDTTLHICVLRSITHESSTTFIPPAQNFTPLCLYNLNNGQNVGQSQQRPAARKFNSYKHESIYIKKILSDINLDF